MNYILYHLFARLLLLSFYVHVQVLSAATISKKMKLKFTEAWISFLRLHLPIEIYRQVNLTGLTVYACSYYMQSKGVELVVTFVPVLRIEIILYGS